MSLTDARMPSLADKLEAKAAEAKSIPEPEKVVKKARKTSSKKK